jgi:hypothetical protein
VAVTNARYLRNGGGAQVGHWVSVLTQLIPHLHEWSAQVQHQGTFQFPYDATVSLRLEDSVRTEYQMRAITSAVSSHAYVRLTLEAARQAFGITLIIDPHRGLRPHALRVDAGGAPKDDHWWKSGGLEFTDAAIQVAACGTPPAHVSDVLVYNRVGSRSLTNPYEVTQLLQASGLTTKVITVTCALTPAQQICVVSQPYAFIITPHGGQMASLMFKHAGTSVIEVSPPGAVLEFFRFVRPAIEPWFALQGRVLWACQGLCADAARNNEAIDAVLLPQGCAICTRKFKGDKITVDLKGLRQLYK